MIVPMFLVKYYSMMLYKSNIVIVEHTKTILGKHVKIFLGICKLVFNYNMGILEKATRIIVHHV